MCKISRVLCRQHYPTKQQNHTVLPINYVKSEERCKSSLLISYYSILRSFKSQWKGQIRAFLELSALETICVQVELQKHARTEATWHSCATSLSIYAARAQKMHCFRPKKKSLQVRKDDYMMAMNYVCGLQNCIFCLRHKVKAGYPDLSVATLSSHPSNFQGQNFKRRKSTMKRILFPFEKITPFHLLTRSYNE
jgi:hypothetical protein